MLAQLLILTSQWVNVYLMQMTQAVQHQQSLLFLASSTQSWWRVWVEIMSCSWDDEGEKPKMCKSFSQYVNTNELKPFW